MKERNGISLKEASLMAVEVNKQKKQIRIDKYNMEPSLCQNCEKELPYNKRKNKFCGHSCSAKFNNIGITRNTTAGKWSKKSCQNCGKDTSNLKYCSNKCVTEYKKEKRRNKIKELGSLIDSKKDKWYLIETRGHKCEVCLIGKWMCKPIPLDLHHKDGNSDNDVLDNLSLTCPNCHRQTVNHGSKNKGNGKNSKRAKYRKDRYDKGLSY